MKKLLVAGVFSLLMILVGAANAAESNRNLISNPSFETADGNRPKGWRTQSWGGKGDFTYAEIARTGNRSVLISSDELWKNPFDK